MSFGELRRLLRMARFGYENSFLLAGSSTSMCTYESRTGSSSFLTSMTGFIRWLLMRLYIIWSSSSCLDFLSFGDAALEEVCDLSGVIVAGAAFDACAGVFS